MIGIVWPIGIFNDCINAIINELAIDSRIFVPEPFAKTISVVLGRCAGLLYFLPIV